MTAALKTANAEGLSEGATVTTTSIGATPTLDFVTPNSGAITATTVNPLRVASSYKVVPGQSVSEECSFGWNLTFASNQLTLTLTIKLLGLPSAAVDILRLTNAAATNNYLSVGVGSDGKLTIFDDVRTVVYTTTTAMVVGNVYRYAIQLDNSTNPGTAAVQGYAGSESTSTVAGLTGSGTGNFTTTKPVRLAVGKVSTNSVTFAGLVIDSLHIDTGTAPLTLSALTQQTVVPTLDVTTGGTTTTGGTGTAASALDEGATPDFTDYVTVPAGSRLEVKLATLQIPADKTGWSITYGLRAGVAGSTMTVSLMQGSTVIATDVPRAAPATDTLYGFPLTTAQATAVTDGTDLRLRFDAS